MHQLWSNSFTKQTVTVRFQNNQENQSELAMSVVIPFKMQWHQMVTFQSVQCHPGLTYHFQFLTSVSPERQTARMSEIKCVS